MLSSPAQALSQPLPHLTIDPVTMRAGTPGKPPASQQKVDAYLGKTLEGRYAIEALLGEGGMGFVYLGRHKLIDKRVAIKILRSDLAADAEMTERFINEARAASSIGSPHIVDISDFGRLDDGAAYFAMEFLDGQPLSAISGNGKVVAPGRLVHIAKQIARGLGVAHTRGVVHRDLKPDNVMLIQRGDDRDFVKVLDFGIAKLQGEKAKLTRAGSVFGTPHYMSPEQAAGVPVDQRTDIYSLGIMLYEMAVGRVPFDADNFMGILTQHMYKAPAPLRNMTLPGFNVPAGLEAVIFKAISKKAELRYGTMEEMIVDLERVERGLAPDAFVDITSRSDQFAIPADYFQNAANVAGTGAGSLKRVALYGTLTALVLLAVIGGVLVVLSRQPATSPIAASTADVVELMPSAAIEAPTPAPATPAKVKIIVTGDPLDAKIALDDEKDEATTQPRTFEISPDEKLKLRIESDGHKTQKIAIDPHKLDAKNPRYVFKLAPVAVPAKAAVATRPAGPTAKPAVTPSATTTAASVPQRGNCPVEAWDPYEHKCSKKY